MTAAIFNAPSPLETSALYFWRMAHGMNTARRGGNDALASEFSEALELVSRMDDHAAVWVAASRSLAPLRSKTPCVVLKFPAKPTPRRGGRHETQGKRRNRRRA